MFGNIFGGKKPWESLTGWGAGILGVVFAAEQLGVLAPGTSTEITQQGGGLAERFAEIANAVGGLAVVLGLRKAAN